MNPGFTSIGIACLLALVGLVPAQNHADFELASIPLADWMSGGDHTDIPWDLKVHDPFLRMDQLLEVSYYAHVDERALNQDGSQPDLYLITRVSTDDGELLEAPNVTRYSSRTEPGPLPAWFGHVGLARRGAMRIPSQQYSDRFFAQPGNYVLWVVLVDRVTQKHNVAKRRIKVSALNRDPLPDLYQHMPKVEFDAATNSDNSSDSVSSELYLPVHNKHPVQIELISALSATDQWDRITDSVPAPIADSLGSLRAMSQLKLASGSLSIVGLDLLRRRIAFEQRNFETVNWQSLREAIRDAQSPVVSVETLEGAKQSGAFFRDFISGRLGDIVPPGGPLRVMIIVGSSQFFAPGSDLHPLQPQGDCHCRIYNLHFRVDPSDVFDEVRDLIKTLHPRSFDVSTAGDLRQALAQIVHDLESL